MRTATRVRTVFIRGTQRIRNRTFELAFVRQFIDRPEFVAIF